MKILPQQIDHRPIFSVEGTNLALHVGTLNLKSKNPTPDECALSDFLPLTYIFEIRRHESGSSNRLHCFTKKNSDFRIRVLLSNAPLGEPTFIVQPGLHRSVKEGSISLVRKLLEEDKIDVNSRDVDGNSPLQLAVIHNQLDIFNLLIERPNIDVNLTDNKGWSPAYHACILKDKTMLKRLAEKGANLNLSNKDGSTALHRAVDNNDLPSVELLLSYKVNVNMLNCHGTPLFAAARKGFMDAARILLQNGAEVNTAVSLGPTPLRIAINNEHHEMIKLLKEVGGKEKPDPAKGSILQQKTLGNLEELNEFLKEDVNRKDEHGRTAAHYWAYSGDEKLGDFLLKLKGVNFDSADSSGRTPLHYAVIEGHLNTVISLLAKDVNVNAKDNQGYFPLHWTAQYKGRVEIAKKLLNHGADVAMTDNFGWSAFIKAAENNNLAMGMLLLDTCQVNVDEKTPDGKTALHRASINGSLAFAEFLLKKGADCHVADKKNHLPIDYAKDEKMIDLFKIMSPLRG